MFTSNTFGRVNYPLGLKEMIKRICMTSLQEAGYASKHGFSTYFCWSKAFIGDGRYKPELKDCLCIQVNISYMDEDKPEIRYADINLWVTEPVWFTIPPSLIRDYKLNNLLK